MRDGADDQDHDDIPNVMELSRIAASASGTTATGRDLHAAEDSPAPGDPPPGCLRPRQPVQPVPPEHPFAHLPDRT